MSQTPYSNDVVEEIADHLLTEFSADAGEIDWEAIARWHLERLAEAAEQFMEDGANETALANRDLWMARALAAEARLAALGLATPSS